jgi:ABC-type phosphate transport system substrate-binding protein
MRKLVQLITVAAGAATVAAMVMAPAMADPINLKTGKTIEPRACDIVGGGSNTTEFVINQFSVNFNKAVLKTLKSSQNQTSTCATQKKSFFYSWDALQNANATSSPMIKFKSGCAAEQRPNGSSAGVADLAANAGGNTGGHPCLDFARSSRGPKTTDPTTVSFVAFAQDNVTYATNSKATNAPKNLTVAQLHAIYTCSVTNWNQVGGKKGTIKPLLPQPNSGTLAFFEAAIGLTAPGACVDQPATLEENEGTDPIFKVDSANEIVPISAGRFVAQAFHSAKCKTTSCATDKTGVFTECKTPGKGQNEFGCDVNGALKLNNVNGTSPTKGTGAKTVLNPPASVAKGGFTDILVRTLFNVVRGTNTIPGYLKPLFSSTGFLCAKSSSTTVQNYGFEPAHLKGFPACGSITKG